MPSVVPSYLEKVARAEKHLVDLKEAIDAYTLSHPYSVRESIEGKKEKNLRRIVFLPEPANTEIPIIAADVVYNLRSSLDHLMACLVANKDKTSVMFPIFFQGVWEAIVPGENAQRTKERMRWASCVKTLDAEVVAILKRLQPRENLASDGTEVMPLATINGLSNRDRHEKLPIAAAGLDNLYLRWTEPDGTTQHAKGVLNEDSGFFQNDAVLTEVPQHAVDVQVNGTPLIVVRVGEDKERRDRHLHMPGFFNDLAAALKREVIEPLIPYVQR